MSKTKTEKVALSLATTEQLLAFANDTHNLELHHRSGKETIIAALRNAGITDEYVDAPVPNVEAQQVKKGEKTVELTLHADPKASKQSDQFFAVGGRKFTIRRGERVKVPEIVYNVLKDANELMYPTDDDGVIIGEPIEVPRFPHTVHSGA